MKTNLFFLNLFFNFLITLLSVWLLVHFFAVLGIFLAIFYPIWWFFFPKKTICLISCLKKGNKKFANPKDFPSSILNALLILIISLISLVFVYFEYQLFFNNKNLVPSKSVTFFIPTKGQYGVNEKFPLKIEINGIKTPINAVQTDIKFDPQKLELIDISTSGSFANIFIQKEINNDLGYARLTGGLPNPGFSGKKGIFATFIFRGKTAGITKIEFLPTSLVLANDKKGTNVLKDFSSISYLITPQKISNNNQDNNVLGESNQDSTQMIFYDDNHVLGTETQLENIKPNDIKITKLKSFYNAVEKFDNIILSQWQKILKVF